MEFFIKTIPHYLICCFEIYMFNDLFKNMLDKSSFHKTIRFTILFFSTIILSLINSFNNSKLNLIIVPFLFYILSCLLYKGSLTIKLLLILLFYILLMIPEFVLLLLLSINKLTHHELIMNSFAFMISVLLTKCLTFILIKLIGYSRNKVVDGGYKTLGYLFVFPIATALIFLGIFYSGLHSQLEFGDSLLILLGSFFLLFANAFVFQLWKKIIEMADYKKQLELFNIKAKMENRHYEQLELINQEHRKLLHNLHNYLGVIGVLSEEHEFSDISNIVKDLNIHLSEISNKIYCKNKLINALIAEKVSIGSKSDIKFEIQITPDFDIYTISDFDIIAILGNLFDNAIENAQLSVSKEINIEAKTINEANYSSIQIKNSYSIEPQIKNKDFISNKKDKQNHGIGLLSVKELVQKNNGILDIEYLNHFFYVTLFLPTINIEETTMKKSL